MKEEQIRLFFASNGKYFEPSAFPMMQEMMLRADTTTLYALQGAAFKDPMITLLLSLLPIISGICGIDRIYLGQVGLGILKLFTLGGLGVWMVIDWFIIMGSAKEKNMEIFMQIMGVNK